MSARQQQGASSTTTRTNQQHHYRRRHVIMDEHHKVDATLDLHGYRKSEAIRTLTDFLDAASSRRIKNGGDVWCLVITGTGAHSRDGPVLRGAVESLLEKRRMVYHKGSGCFVVNACSGFALYKEDQPTDSKVVVTDEVDQRNFGSGSWSHRLIGSVPHKGRQSEQSKELQKSYRNQKNEEKALTRAVSESLLYVKKEQKQDEDQLLQALTISVDENRATIEEEEKIRKAMEEAARQLERDHKEEAALLQILELTRKQCQEQQQEDEEELLRVLERSTLDF